MRFAAFAFDWRTTFFSAALLVAILGLSAVITQWFARKMYKRCDECGALNARRRDRCRICENTFG